ncbi:hypothetical protein U9M48_027423 [Paspalum notatum var. saurae]|uniref:Uncharacterized protein n=1 Tax=Paspalum notatum var. saurae TaxID=547442 RepID=A0AAQ3TUR2_PASNO
MKEGKSKKEASSSSSEEEEDSDEDDQAQRSSDDDDEEEIATLIKRMEKALKKLDSKGIPITIEEIEHNRQRKKERKGGYFGCGEKEHYMDSCPIIANEEKKKKRHKLKKEKEQRDRHKALTSIGMWVDVSSDEDHHKKHSKSTSRKSFSTSHKCLMAEGKNESDPFVSWYEEIEVLNQEVDHLKKDVARLQGQREQAQPSQDNCLKVVKKFEESQPVVCFFCNKEGHKSYIVKLKRKEEANKKEGKQKKSVTPKAP